MTHIFRLVLVVALLFVVGGCAPRTFPGRMIDDSYPTREEEKLLGDRLSTLLIQYLDGEHSDQALKDYLNHLGQQAMIADDNSLTLVRIANHSSSVFLALPGGYVIVTRGLLQELESEGQLAALFAGETASLQTGHGAQRMAEFIRHRAVFLQEVEPGEPGYLQFFMLARELRELLASVPDQVSADHSDQHRVRKIDSRAFSHHIRGLREAAPAYTLYHQARQAELEEDRAAALQLYRQAVQLQPRSPLLTALGMAYLRNEDLIPARRYLRQSIQDDPDFYQPRLGLGYIHLQRSEWSDAVRELEASLALLPTVEGVFLLAEAEQGRGNTARARNLYLHLQKADGQSALGRAATDRLRQLSR